MIFAACNLIPLLIQDHQDNETRKEWDSMVLKKQDQEDQDGTEEEESSEPVVLDPDWASLQSTNPDIVGWIYIPDTVINYPIVQGSDNEYYLDHSSMRNVNTIGSIFLDAAASQRLQRSQYDHLRTQRGAERCHVHPACLL